MFLDTSFCVDLFREQNKLAEVAKCPASKKLKSLGDIPVYISVFVLCELEAGARLSSNPGI